MGKILSVCNQKGGVGKTTTAINISTYVANKGKKVLLIDSDPQANATSGMGLDKKQVEKSSYDLLIGKEGIEDLICKGPVENLFIVPSNVSLAGAEIELVEASYREYRLRNALAQEKEKFDYIFIDCPPSLGLLTLNALVASDGIIIPLQCEYYSLEGLSQLMETISLVKRGLNPAMEIVGVILTMADFRTKLTAEVIKEVRAVLKDKVFNTIIPRSIRLGEAPGFGKPIFLYDRESIGAQKYEMLATELIRRCSQLEEINPVSGSQETDQDKENNAQKEDFPVNSQQNLE